MQKHFSKNLILNKKKKKKKIPINRIDDDDKKVRDHCHVTRKFRGAIHWSYNITLH